MNKLSTEQMAQLLEQELSTEGLSEKEKSDVTLSVMGVVLLLLDAGFPIESKIGLITMR